MKPYIATTGVIFGLLTFLHIWRAVVEGPHVAANPWFILMTVASAILCLWAIRLLWRRPQT